MKPVTKIAKLQSSKYKTHSNGSNETSIFISHKDAESLGIEDDGPVEFQIYKEDFIKGLGMLMALSSLPLYKKSVFEFTTKDFQNHLAIIENYFGDNKTAKYTVNFFVNKSQTDRNYFKDLTQNNLNVRDFLIEGHSVIHFIPDENGYTLRFETFAEEVSDDSLQNVEEEKGEENRPQTWIQRIYYGVPGCGKSHEIGREIEKIAKEKRPRVVFHPEYTNADFIGQILPKVSNNDISYEFTPGPFTTTLLQALASPDDDYYLIIEEINRGNASAIFGEIFQLLDRTENGRSRYTVVNRDVIKYVYDIANGKIEDSIITSSQAEDVYSQISDGLYIPHNLSILATMNTSDQNVFTLDNAFQRRFDMKQIPNKFTTDENDPDFKYSEDQRNATIEGFDNVSWEKFQTTTNRLIAESSKQRGLGSMEDKRLGCWFVVNTKNKISSEVFANKVLKYLWDDAFKFDREKIFDKAFISLEDIICKFEKNKENVQEATSIFNKDFLNLLKKND